MTNSEPPVVRSNRHEPVRDILNVAKDKETSLVAKVIWIAVLGVLFAATVYAKFAIFH